MDLGNEMGLAPCEVTDHSESETPEGPEDHDSVSVCVTRPGKPCSPPVRRVLGFKESMTPACLDDTFRSLHHVRLSATT